MSDQPEYPPQSDTEQVDVTPDEQTQRVSSPYVELPEGFTEDSRRDRHWPPTEATSSDAEEVSVLILADEVSQGSSVSYGLLGESTVVSDQPFSGAARESAPPPLADEEQKAQLLRSLRRSGRDKDILPLVGDEASVLAERSLLLEHLQNNARNAFGSRVISAQSELALDQNKDEEFYFLMGQSAQTSRGDVFAQEQSLRLALREQRWEDADQLLDALADSNLSDDASAYWLMQRFFVLAIGLEQTDRALELLRSAERFFTHRGVVLLSIIAELAWGDGERALQALKRTDAFTWSEATRTQLALLKGRVAERFEMKYAGDVYQEILARGWASLSLVLARMRTAYAQKKYSEVIQFLESQLVHTKEPSLVRGWRTRLAQLMDPAEQDLADQIAYDDGSSPVRSAILLYWTRQHEKPELCRQVLQKWSANLVGRSKALVLLELSDSWARSGKFEESRRALEEAITADPSFGETDLLYERLEVLFDAPPAKTLKQQQQVQRDENREFLRRLAKVSRSGSKEMALMIPDEASPALQGFAANLAIDVALLAKRDDIAHTILKQKVLQGVGERSSANAAALAVLSLGQPAEHRGWLEKAHGFDQRDITWLRAWGQASSRDNEDDALWCWIQEAEQSRGELSAFAWFQASRSMGFTDAEALRTAERGWQRTLEYLPLMVLLERAYRKPLQAEKLRTLYETMAVEFADTAYMHMLRLRAAFLMPSQSSEALTIYRSVFGEQPNDMVLLEWLLYRSDTKLLSLLAENLETWVTKLSGAEVRVFSLRTAMYWERAEKWDRAAEIYARVLEQHSDDTHASRGLDRCEMQLGRYAQVAERLFKKIKTTTSPSERVRDLERLADHQLKASGDHSLAELSWSTVLQEFADHRGAARSLERLAMQAKDDSELKQIAANFVGYLASPRDVLTYAMFVERFTESDLSVRLESARKIWTCLHRLQGMNIWFARKLWTVASDEKSDELLLEALSALDEQLETAYERSNIAVPLAEMWGETRDAQRSREILGAALTMNPTHPALAEELAWYCLQQQLYPQAAQALSSAAQVSMIKRRSAELWYQSGLLWQDYVGDEGRALAAYKEAAAVDIGYADVFGRLLSMLRATGSSFELADFIEARIGAGGDSSYLVSLYLHLAKVRSELRDFKKSKEAYRGAVGLDPDNLEALQGLAELCLQFEEWGEAAEHLIRLARLHKEAKYLVPILKNLGFIYDYKLHDTQKAIAAYQRALTFDANQIDVLRRLSTVFLNLGDHDQRLRVLEDLVERDSDSERNIGHRIELAKISMAAGEGRKAEQTLEAARRLAPLDLRLLKQIADLYQQQEARSAWTMHLNRACGDFRKAIATDIADRAAWSGLVEVLGWQNKVEGAWAVAAAAEAAGVYDTNISQLLDDRGRVHRFARKPLPESILDLIAPHPFNRAVRELFTVLGPALDEMVPFPIHNYSLENDLSIYPSLEGLSADIEQWLAKPVRFRVARQASMIATPVSSSPLCVIVAQDLLNNATIQGQRFLATRAALLAYFGFSSILRLPYEQISLMLWAIVYQHNRNLAPPDMNAAQLQQLGKKIIREVPRKFRSELMRTAAELVSSSNFDPGLLTKAMLAYANRVSLMLNGSVKDAVETLRKIEEMLHGYSAERSLRPEPDSEIHDLIFFVISDAYFDARSSVLTDLVRVS